jgi:predicted nucleic acid-binding protein
MAPTASLRVNWRGSSSPRSSSDTSESEEDEQNGVWQWFGVTSALLEKARKAVLALPSTVFVRSGDALHLACAEEHGFQEVYTNDRHMLQAAKHFHVMGVNVLNETS